MRVRIAGAGTDRAAWLNGYGGPQVDIVGPVEALAPLFDRARVFIAPTRFAAGIPIKVIDAARHGVPVVASSLVAGQLGWRNGFELLTADTAPEFAAACVALHSDPALWARVREAALAAVRRDFDPAPFAAGVCEEAHATYDSRRGPCAPFRR
jgi:glycosyltransferase involved in cell wall biosynthesis